MSPLQTLAPDQRAVLELLLRQGRSYAELSELLGLPEDAVRDRAHTALAALAPDRAAPIGEDGAVADWILGQLPDDEASSTRDAVARMPAWRAWATEVTGRLGEVSGAKVPAVPAAADKPKPKAAAKPRGSRPRPLRNAAAAAPAAATAKAAKPAEAQRPARKRTAATASLAGAGGGAVAGLRSSKLGGAILIGVLALLVAAFLFWFLGRGDDNANSPAAASASATATPSATPDVVVQVPLKGVGNKAQGLMQVVKRDDGKLVFALGANKIPPNGQREVYAVWFMKKGGAPRNLGFAQQRVGNNGVFTTGGPQQGQEDQFAQWLADYDTVVVARADAKSAKAKRPGQIVLRGTLPGGQG